MRKKAFNKNLLREIKKSKSRFFSIFIIVAIGVAFFAGVRATSPDMLITGNKYLKDNNFADLSILSYRGFSDKDIENIKKIKGVKAVTSGYNFDAMAIYKDSGKPVVVNSYKIGGQNVNKLILVEGRLPRDEDECVTEKEYLKSQHVKIGESVELKTSFGTKKFKIVGTTNSPRFINNYDRGKNSLGNGRTVAFFQIGEKSSVELSIPPAPGIDRNKVYGELLVQIDGAKNKNIFFSEYKDIIMPFKEKIQNLGKLNNPQGWIVQDTDDNNSISGYKSNSDRIGAIGTVFPLFFFIIATLVCLTSMTRMVEEQRTQIGSLKALGYSKRIIISEYFLYSLWASIGGSIVGALIGFKLFPTVIFNAYRIMYNLPPITAPFNSNLAITSTIVAVVCTTLAAIFACIKELVAVPAELMRPKAPKAGKRIFLERISFVWKRMSFTKKVTARNILRYKKRFFMTIIGIAGCTALLLTGFGLRNSILSITDKQFNEIYSYNMMAFFSQPTSDTKEIENFKKQIEGYKEINKSLVMTQKPIYVNNKSKIGTVYLMVPENNLALNSFIHLKSEAGQVNMSDNGVIITKKLSKFLHASKGDSINITLGEKVVRAKVSDVTEQYVGHYVYMSPKYYQQLFKEPTQYNGFISIINNKSRAAEDSLSTDLMKKKTVNYVSFTTSISDDFRKSMNGMNSVIWVLIISAAALAFVVMFNLTSININERIRELATIKVLGFYDKEVAEYIFRENMILSILGTLFGLVLGLGLHRYVVITSEIEMVMFVRSIKLPSFIYSAVLTIIFAGLVNVVMYKRIKNIDMVESLKSGE